MAENTEIKAKYGIYPIGLLVRKQLNQEFIYRVRKGNGYYGTERNRKYQDKYIYFIPTSINNAEGEPYRAQLKAAVEYWKTSLTDDEKTEYNLRATYGLKMSGYNLFIKEAMTGVYPMYVYRGDPADFDFSITDFTTDATWRELDISAIIPVQAKAIHIRITIRADQADGRFAFKKYGQTNSVNSAQIRTQVANQAIPRQLIVAVDSNKKIEYTGENINWDMINFVINGWWT